MAQRSNLVHPAQPGQSFLHHTELRFPCILWLSIDNKTLRYRSETEQCAVRCRAEPDTDGEWLISLMVFISGDSHIICVKFYETLHKATVSTPHA